MSDTVSVRRATWNRVVHTESGAAVGAMVAFGLGVVIEVLDGPSTAAHLLFAAGLIVGGWRRALEGLTALTKRRLDVDLLMVVAALAAVMLGDWRDAALLIVIFASTGALEAAATARTTAGVRALLVEAPETAERFDTSQQLHTVAADTLTVGDRVLVRPGGRIPGDGTVIEGDGAVDESTLTGESLPATKHPGSLVLAGSTALDGHLVIEVTVDPEQSVLHRLSVAVAGAVEARPASQLAIERFEQRYSIGVVVSAAAMAVLGPWWLGWSWSDMVHRTMSFLVVASPCAVVLATMPAMLSALAAAARQGVLIRGGDVLERLAIVDTVAFDKTGTLTLGQPKVMQVLVASGPKTLDATTAIAAAAAIERYSEHPIGRAVVDYARTSSIIVPDATNIEVKPSQGVEGYVHGQRVRVGGEALVGPLPSAAAAETVVGIEIDGYLAATMVMRDQLRERAHCTVACLGRAGVADTLILTGDRREAAEDVATLVGIESAHSGLFPHDKAAHVRMLRDRGHQVTFIGDGINDAAALVTATVGVSLGQRGAALAVDAADVVIINDDLHLLADVIGLAKATRRIVHQNLVFALVVIVLLVSLTLVGRLPLLLGVMGHEGSSVIVALNGLRLLRWRPHTHGPV